jgi:hypothetical protein
MKEPFAYVLYIDRGAEEHLVSLYQSLDDAEAALRAYAQTIVIGPSDSEIVEVLAEDGVRARIYACTQQRRGQSSVELVPFADGTAAAA